MVLAALVPDTSDHLSSAASVLGVVDSLLPASGSQGVVSLAFLVAAMLNRAAFMCW